MIKVPVEVEDYDTCKSFNLILPCDIKSKLDISHELMLIDWDSGIFLGSTRDVLSLNAAIERINTENPAMTLPILEALYDASYVSSLDNEEFLRKICENDFMLEPVCGTGNWCLLGLDEEACACYLATEMCIPFAKNVTQQLIKEMKGEQIDNVDWEIVWEYYEIMGFEKMIIDRQTYLFHWGNAA